MTSVAVKSIKADCQECSAEVVITTIFAPPFRDISPLCPYCHFPMTKEITLAEVVHELGEKLKELAS